MDDKVRKLSAGELRALRLLGSRLPQAQKKQFLDDLQDCLITEATADGSRLIFTLRDYTRPTYRGQHAYPIEGVVNDTDGSQLSVSIYADPNDRLLELELVKWEDKPICDPDWSTFRLAY
jgi:hypothetical protein